MTSSGGVVLRAEAQQFHDQADAAGTDTTDFDDIIRDLLQVARPAT